MAEKIINIKFKKLTTTAHEPFHGSKFSAGYDLYADTEPVSDSKNNLVYHTGIAVQIPKGYAGYLFPRSSNSKTDLRLTNCVGVIDCDYRGEIIMKFRRDIRQFGFWSLLKLSLFPSSRHDNISVIDYGVAYKKGERIGQLIILPTPKVRYEQVEELDDTERGTGGYGSTGK